MIRITVANYGVMEAELDWEAAPNTCANFVELASSGFYEGLLFHRIIKGFMIQGGWGDLKGKHLDYSIKGEFASNGVKNPLLHKRGVLSMARTMYPDSASSQFFIMHKDAPHLDGEYAAFGHLTSGFDVLDKIASVRTDRSDRPYDPVVIEKIEVIDEPVKPVQKIR
ncbi:MAG TPA: peptidylprolyl isomerase [Firmicutes bacterium]|nr:peptidylprolyl isomerase [Bacillota bacterium]